MSDGFDTASLTRMLRLMPAEELAEGVRVNRPTAARRLRGMPDLGKQLADVASVVTLPAALTRNANRATEAVVDIRDQLATLVDLPREILDQLRAMQELAEQMNATAQELHAIAEPMLQAAQGIHDLARPMLETGQAATRAAEQARESVERTNALIEQSLELAAPIQGITERAASLRDRLRGERPPDERP